MAVMAKVFSLLSQIGFGTFDAQETADQFDARMLRLARREARLTGQAKTFKIRPSHWAAEALS
jgi:hypothetical protein